MKEEKFNCSLLEILYNIYDRTICLCTVERKIDGDLVFHDVETGEVLDLASFAEVGYKMLSDKYIILNRFREYSLADIIQIVEEYNNLEKRKEIEGLYLIDLNALQDQIAASRYNYDMRYPVEQIEIRYSDILNDYMLVYVRFDSSKGRLAYMNILNGEEVPDDIMDLYDYYPRDAIFNKADYSPRELMIVKEGLKKGIGNYSRKRG